jgi:signal transduction histidine kinase
MMSEISSADSDRRLAESKLQALAEFAAGAGHEINNPIATIVGYVQQLLPGESHPDRCHALATIGAQAYRVRDMIGDLMLFARPPEPRPQSLDLSMVVREMAKKLADESQPAPVRWQIEAGSPVDVFADPVQLRVAISSLLRNSCEALVAGGTIAVKTATSHQGERPAALLTISDDGPGLSERDREHLFDPFYSGRQAGRGLGFGLPKAWRIVTLHGGRIEVISPPDGGVAFTIVWPASAETLAAPVIG